MKSTDAYRAFRQEVDRIAAKLTNLHAPHLVCRAGCSSCCTNLSVFPVEYHAILCDLRTAGVNSLPFDSGQPCGFLKEGRCVLYEFRPLICRTHGLPIAFTNETLDPPEVNVSFCPLNFSAADLEDFEFGPGNTLDLDELNGRLLEVNEQYLAELPATSRAPQRVPLSQLARDLHSGSHPCCGGHHHLAETRRA